jgi:hypothetical protein
MSNLLNNLAAVTNDITFALDGTQQSQFSGMSSDG